MQRVVSVWLPMFPIERMRLAQRLSSRTKPRSGPAAPRDRDGRHDDARRPPWALVEPGPRGLHITAVDDAAAAAGVAVGQSLADVRAGLPQLHTRAAEPERDAAALLALAQWAGRYGPCRNIDGKDGFWVDIAGVGHLFGGERALLADCVRRLAQAGFRARIGLADTPAAASALARYGAVGGSAIAAAGKTAEALAGLPVEALRLTPQTVLLLKRLGLYRIGQLYALPRASLARRFRDLRAKAGPAVALADGVVLRLDQALGTIRDPRPPLEAPPCRMVRQVFAEPLIAHAGLETAVAATVDRLCDLLAEAGEGARRLRLVVYRTDGSAAAIDVGTSGASRDGRHLRQLLGENLGDIDAGFGVDVVTLEAVAVDPLGAVQASLGGKARSQMTQGLSQLVDRLTNRLGADRLHRVAPRSSHLPEQADVAVAPLAAVADPPAIMSAYAAPAPRPPLMLRHPEPIEVVAEVPEGPPRRFLWRRAPHSIVKAEGPERIEPAWWQALSAATARPLRPRDYYRVEDDRGGRFWVYREGLYDRGAEDGAPSWYVHGLFG